MAKAKSSTFNFKKLVKSANLLQAEFAEHDALRRRLIELMDAIAEELTVSELHEMVAQWEHHPSVRVAA